jgi:integrase
MANQKKPQKFTDAYVQALREFEVQGLFLDSVVRGLRLRLGVHRCTWQFFREFRDHGKRGSICKRLGFFPEMNVETARNEALQIAARFASGRREPGRGQATKFSDAYSAYVEYLRRQSERRGKPASWAINVTKLGRLYLLPEFGKWSLIEMSNSPAVIADWHRKLSETTPFSANRCAELVRVIYRRAARLDRSLPAAANPASAVEYNSEKPRETGIADFPAWAAAWGRIPDATRRAFHILNLLLGARPGELQRLCWRDIDCKARTITIRASKTGGDIVAPMSWPIAKALRMARGAGAKIRVVFAGPTGKPMTRGRDGLPVAGNSLRHAFRSIAAQLGVDDVSIRLLMGHSLVGISSGYISKMMMHAGPSLRSAQRRISRRIVSLLE